MNLTIKHIKYDLIDVYYISDNDLELKDKNNINDLVDGYICVCFNDAITTIVWMYIQPKFRGKKYGTHLLKYVEKITLENAKNICTNISFYDFEKYTDEWYNNKNLIKASKIINAIFDKGYSVMDILDSYFQFIKITNLLDETSKYKSIIIICEYNYLVNSILYFSFCNLLCEVTRDGLVF